MKIRKGSAILGVSAAAGAALIASPAAAYAAPAAYTPPAPTPPYAATSSATAGSLNFGTGPAGPANTSTATDAKPTAGTTTGIYHGDLPNGLGTVVLTNDGDVLTTRADVFANGDSTACSSAAAGACGEQSTPLDLRLNLKRVIQVGNSFIGNKQVNMQQVIDALPGPIGNYSIVLGITGPTAECTAGPSVGSPSSAFQISRTVVSGTVDLQDGTKSVIGGAKTIGTNGDVLVPLIVNAVNPALAKIPNADVKLTFTPGTDNGAGIGPSTSAEVGTLVVTLDGFTVATFTGGKVTCGPNLPAAPAAPLPPAPSASGPAAGPDKPAAARPVVASRPVAKAPARAARTRFAKASDDSPLGGIPLWADIVAGGVVLSGGLALWRGRRRRGTA